MATREGAAGAFVKGVLDHGAGHAVQRAVPGPGVRLSRSISRRRSRILIFGCIGLGMASPYLLIGAFPQLIRFLPKPGRWMERSSR